MAVITVFNQKGGVGKTTTCLNVAAALARNGLKPIVIDLDPQGHLTLALGVRPASAERTVSAFFRDGRPLAELVTTLESGLRLVPAHMELSKVDAQLSKSPQGSSRLRQGLAESFGGERVPIIIDCCPVLGVLSLNAVLAADRVLVPVSADFLSMQGANKLDGALHALESLIKRPIERRLVVTRFDGRRRMAHQIYDKLKERLGDALCDTRVAESVSLAESPAYGKDIFAFAGASRGAKDYFALTDELVRGGFFD